MKRWLTIAALTGVVSAEADAQSIGNIGYFRNSLDALDRELRHAGARRTGWYQFGSLNDEHYRDHTIRLDERGWVAVGADEDTARVSLTPVNDGQVEGWERESGARSARLYFSRPGTYVVRLRMEDCREAYCFYTMMAGYR